MKRKFANFDFAMNRMKFLINIMKYVKIVKIQLDVKSIYYSCIH